MRNGMEVKTSNYKTKDWNESALLLSHGLRLIGIRRKGVCYFEFEDGERATGLVESYWRGDLSVNARAFVDAQRRVKDMIHRDQRASA